VRKATHGHVILDEYKWRTQERLLCMQFSLEKEKMIMQIHRFLNYP